MTTLAPHDVQAAARLFEGRTLGGYRIARAIASGGMATVFLARRTGPGRFAQTAALKVIHPHLADEREFVEMFMEEARIASSINHPNVCRVLDFGQAEGTFYLAMEYVRGETWATTLSALAASREGRARIHALSTHVMAQACEGLYAVHSALDPSGVHLQIVHRDLSPHNLLVAYDGSVRVLDFGVASARALGQRLSKASTDVIRGRYAYMAPEQVLGGEVDQRADIWSLGVCLREALTGSRLFERDTQVATMLAVTQEPLPPWPKHVPLLLREICDQALEREPAERFASAREFGSALSRVAALEAEPCDGIELSRWMHRLFAEQIEQKRAELSELAYDDAHSGTFTSIVPPSAPRAAGPRSTGRLRRVKRPLTQLGRWGGALVLSLGAAALAFYLTSARERGPAVGDNPPELVVSGGLPAATAPTAAAQPDGAWAQAPTAQASTPVPTLEEAFAREQAGEQAELRTEREPQAEDTDASESARERRKRRRERAAEERASAAQSQAATASASEAQATGTLVVGANGGWAEIWLGGRLLGTTPLRKELEVGSHELEVRFFGASPRKMPVVIRAGESTKLRLEP